MEPSEVKRHLKRLGFRNTAYPVIMLLHSCGSTIYWVLKVDGKVAKSLGAVCQQCNSMGAMNIPLERLRELTPKDIRRAQLIAEMDEEGARRDREIVNNLITFDRRIKDN